MSSRVNTEHAKNCVTIWQRANRHIDLTEKDWDSLEDSIGKAHTRELYAEMAYENDYHSSQGQ